MSFGVDDLRFSTSYWYSDVDLHDIARLYGDSALRNLVFHAVAFEANKLCSLQPEEIDFGPYQDLVTPQFEFLWTTIFQHVWGQWRYENNLPDYQGPKIVLHTEPSPSQGPIEHRPGSIDVLSFVGGGKDSLVSMRLMEDADVPFATYGYSSSIYGAAQPQHNLIDGLVQHTSSKRHHRHWIFDDFMDSPVLTLGQSPIKTLTAAETPSSVFGALPVALLHGYSVIAVGNEHSADFGNLTWQVTGEEINHQWGKSLDAEIAIQQYIQDHLVSTISYSSVLKPVYDPVIFGSLNRSLEALRFAHSCNVTKPWCEKCAKCAYVWINYLAYLPDTAVNGIFRTNLLDTPENQVWFRQMLGLAEHTPFECVGQVPEARLAFELARRRGYQGVAMSMFEAECPRFTLTESTSGLLDVDPIHHHMPAWLADALLPPMQSNARLTRAIAEEILTR